MRVFVCSDFEGHYPVGSAAVVVAQNKTHAENMLNEELVRCGLSALGQKTLQEVSMKTERAIILCDGNY